MTLFAFKTQRRTRGGVTLTELLVVLAIIGLLATIAVPTYLNKVELARVATAKSEVRALAEAETVVAIRHGFYVPLMMLDDIAEKEDRLATDQYDDLFNTREQINPLYLIDPFASIELQEQSTDNQFTLQDSSDLAGDFNKRVSDLYFYWDGPFINFKRVWTGGDYKADVLVSLDDDEIARDWPLDPWGNPYLFFSPLGIIGSGADPDTPDLPYDADQLDRDNFGDGRLTTDTDYEFDRFAIVSFGPNGVLSDGNTGDGLDNDFDDNDDIIYTFGRIPNESAFRLF